MLLLLHQKKWIIFFPLSTSRDDSALTSMIHNYIFRVSLLQPVQEQDLIMQLFNDLCFTGCLIGLQTLHCCILLQ